MQNVVLSPIDPESLISSISERVTANVLQAISNAPTASAQKEVLLTVPEAAKFLTLTVPTVYSKVSRGELPYMKRGKRLYFSDIDLLNYLKEGRSKSSSQICQEAEAGHFNRKK